MTTRERAAGKLPFPTHKTFLRGEDFLVCASFCARVASFLEAVGVHWQIALKVQKTHFYQ